MKKKRVYSQRMLMLVVACLTTWLTAWSANAQPIAGVYGANEERQRLEVSIPAGTPAGARLPTVVFVHGGYWSGGNLTQMNADVQAAVDNGFVGVTVNYRYAAAGSRWPAQIQDVNCAIRYIKSRAAELNIDPRRVAVSGYSAGAHLALAAAFAQGVPEFEACEYGTAANSPARDSSVRAVVSRSGPTDLEAAWTESGHVSFWGRVAALNLMGSFNGITARFRRASAECYALGLPDCPSTAPRLPVLQIHGQDDTTIRERQPLEMQATLLDEGYPNPLYVRFCNQGHGWGGVHLDQAIDITMTFLRGVFFGESAPPGAFDEVDC